MPHVNSNDCLGLWIFKDMCEQARSSTQGSTELTVNLVGSVESITVVDPEIS